MTLARLAAMLYPRWWRERYGSEFEALLEDASPGAAGAFDIAKGALTMQLTSCSPRRVFGLCALGGLAMSLAAYFGQPARPVSRALLHIPALATSDAKAEVTNQLAIAGVHVLRRAELITAIHDLDLYPGERQRLPLEDVIEQMRDDVKLETVAEGNTVAVAVEFRNSGSSFSGEDREAQAKAAANWFAKKIVDSGEGFEVLQVAALPTRGLGVPRPLVYYGVPMGFVAGLLMAWWTHRKERTA